MDVLSDAMAAVLPAHGVLSVTGAGGKTSLVCLLARSLKAKGERVLVSTTTRMRHPSLFPYPVDAAFLDDQALRYRPRAGEAVFFALPCGDGRVASPGVEVLSSLADRYDHVLVEADGARMLPLKYHEARDPVVVPGSFVVAVMGAGAYGARRSAVCFGWKGDGVADRAFFQYLLDAPEGALKGGADLVLLNHYEAIGEEAKRQLDLLRCPVPLWHVSVRENARYGFRTV